MVTSTEQSGWGSQAQSERLRRQPYPAVWVPVSLQGAAWESGVCATPAGPGQNPTDLKATEEAPGASRKAELVG